MCTFLWVGKCWWGWSCWIFGGGGGLTCDFAEVFGGRKCKNIKTMAIDQSMLREMAR
jgi:hypothetical protein